MGEQGLYHEDTRYLSHQELLIEGARPLYLGSTVKENNSLLIIELMNPDLTREGEVRVRKGTVHVFRAKLLWEGACYEHIRLTNHGREPVDMRFAMTFEADFIDLFEVGPAMVGRLTDSVAAFTAMLTDSGPPPQRAPQIAEEARTEPELLRRAPVTTPVGRLDEARAARRLHVRWEPGAPWLSEGG